MQLNFDIITKNTIYSDTLKLSAMFMTMKQSQNKGTKRRVVIENE